MTTTKSRTNKKKVKRQPKPVENIIKKTMEVETSQPSSNGYGDIIAEFNLERRAEEEAIQKFWEEWIPPAGLIAALDEEEVNITDAINIRFNGSVPTIPVLEDEEVKPDKGNIFWLILASMLVIAAGVIGYVYFIK